MRISIPLLLSLAAASTLSISACGADTPSADDLNQAGQSSGGTGGISGSTGGTLATGGGGGAGGTSGLDTGGAAGDVLPVAGMDMGGASGASGAAGDVATGGVGGMVAGGSGGSGGNGGTGGEIVETGPYAPRTGSFKMMVYSRTKGWTHGDSIATGKAMLAEIAVEQGFEIVNVETDEENDEWITREQLSQFEIVFFMNSTGDIFTPEQQQAYEDWMTEDNGAFAGVHSATDTESGWPFYSEVTGQYYDMHVTGPVTPGRIVFESDMLDFPALKDLPNPWQRNEEWYFFRSWQTWSEQPGFQILGKKDGCGACTDGEPIMWIREYGNFRAFYTAIGHEAVVFEDPDVKKHVTGGLMWAVRREHLIQ